MKRLASFVMVMMLAFVTVFGASAQPAFAKSKGKVKSLKVQKAKKKMTLTVGQKKTFKVKIKASKKKYAKFTVKSSKKKVVKVTKKGKKITLKALKAGKAKVTVRSKTNKKKKYVMTIKVKAKSSPEIIPDVPKVLTMEATNIDFSVFLLNFNMEKDLKAEDLTIEAKIGKNGEYKKIDTPFYVTTSDKKEYSVVLEGELDLDYEYFRFSIKNSTVVAECRIYMSEDFTYRGYTYGTVGQLIDDEDTCMVGVGDCSLVSVGKMPGDLQCTVDPKGFINFKGTVNEAGVYIVPIKIKDGDGVVYNYEQIFAIGDAQTISAYCRDITVYGHMEDGKFTANGTVFIFADGGPTNKQTYSLLDGSDEGFFIQDNGEVGFDFDKVGEHTAQVRITDGEVHKDITVKVIVEAMAKISGYVKTKSGAPITGASISAYPFTFDSTTEFVTGETDQNGYYEAYVKKGKCNIYCSYKDVEKIEPNKNVTEDTTVNFVMNNVYAINMISPNANIKYGDWRIAEDEKYEDGDFVGYGNLLTLPAGTYNLFNKGFFMENNKLFKFLAKILLTVTGDMEVSPEITYSEVPYEEAAIGVNQAIIPNNDYLFFKFVPEVSGSYRIASNFATGDGDPACAVIGPDMSFIGSDDDITITNLNFDFNVDLEAGATYYIILNEYDEQGLTGEVSIELDE